MSKSRVSIVIPSYNGVMRVSALLSSISIHDPIVFDLCDIHIFEDPSNFPGVRGGYDKLATIFPVHVHHIPTWSNMHGAAQYAFESVQNAWIIYLGDDTMVTPFALSNMIYFLTSNELKTVALVQFPYWNAHDLSEDQTEREYPGPALLKTKHDMYTSGYDWLKEVPRNPHWDGEGLARPYVNVNGVGFAVHRDTWEKVGGFCMETWCLDESLSVRVWINSKRSVVCLPGPPIVHFFAGATLASPPQHDLHNEAAWIRGMKMTKEEAGRASYEKMFERSHEVKLEMARARYY